MVMIADSPRRSASIQTAKVLMNWNRTATGMSVTRAVNRMKRRARTQPRTTPPPQVTRSFGSTVHPENTPVIAVPTARR